MKRENINIKENEKFLRQISSKVKISDSDLKDLENFCISNELFALAAVQIGIPKRIIYLKNTRLDIDIEDKTYNEAEILINPKIINRKGLTKYWEACVSCGNLMGLVNRPYEITVKYQDQFGKDHQKKFKDFKATVLSHEMDHLDGILHIDKAEKILEMTKVERKKFREKNPYQIISKDCIFI